MQIRPTVKSGIPRCRGIEVRLTAVLCHTECLLRPLAHAASVFADA